jgi:hypothetical protein
MRLQAAFLLILILAAGRLCPGQDVESLNSGATEESQDASSTVNQDSSIKTSLIRVIPNVFQDQKRIIHFPLSVARGHHLKPVLAIAGITAGLVAFEEHNEQVFKRTQSFDGFNRIFSSQNTSIAMVAIPSAFYLVGLAKKDKYAQKSFWLAGEAVLDTAILTTVMKDIDRRWLPRDVPPDAGTANTWFKYKPGQHLAGNGSFPSGHTIAAFSLATVYAKRYPNPRWRVWLAYGLATIVGFSRVTLQSHFPSDVFAGGALGYAVANYIVLRR